MAIRWTAEATAALRNIRIRYRLNAVKANQLRQIAEAWAERRIADADAKGYDDDPRAVMDSDVGYSWGYMMICERRQ